MYSAARLDPAFQADWEAFNDQSINGTFLSSRKFLGYHPPERFNDHSLVVRKGSEPFAIIPACEVSVRGEERRLISHSGATYGGIIFKRNPTVSEAIEVVSEINRYTKDAKFHSILLKQSPVIFHRLPSQTIDFALLQKGYRPVTRELTTAVDLSEKGTASDILEGYDPTTRNKCRRGERSGLTFSTSTDYSAFFALLKESLERHRATPVHSLADLLLLGQLFPEAIQLFGVFLEGKMIAGCWAFLYGNRVFHTQYLAMNYDYSRLAPMNFLILKLMTEAHKRRFRYFNFGISTEHGGDTVNLSLYAFKEGFGGTGVLLNTYEKKDL